MNRIEVKHIKTCNYRKAFISTGVMGRGVPQVLCMTHSHFFLLLLYGSTYKKCQLPLQRSLNQTPCGSVKGV